MNPNTFPVRLTLFALILLASKTTATIAQGPLPQASEQHQLLLKDVGVWDAETKMWMAPGTEPMLSKATETNKMLGKMWLISDFEGSFGGMPFRGHGQFGYDTVTKKYIGTWVDTMSPHLSVMEGTQDPSGKLVMMSKGRDAMTGKEQITKMVSTYTDEDHRIFEMHAPVPDQEGQWWKMMEVQYTRRK